MTDNVEILTANSGFLTMTSSTKMQQGDCDNVEQSKMARLASETSVLPLPVSVVVAITWRHLHGLAMVANPDTLIVKMSTLSVIISAI